MRLLGFALMGALIGALIVYAATWAVLKRERRRP